jgi:hypothetical protein
VRRRHMLFATQGCMTSSNIDGKETGLGVMDPGVGNPVIFFNITRDVR